MSKRQEVKISLTAEEYKALTDASTRELRPVELQARYMLRCQLEKTGDLAKGINDERQSKVSRD